MSDLTEKSSQKNSEDSSEEVTTFKKPTNRKRKKKVLKKENTKKINDNKTPEEEISQPHLTPHIVIEKNMLELESEDITPQSSAKGSHTPQDQIETGSQNNRNIKTTTKNFSTRMNEINNINYNHLFYLNVDANIVTDRIQMADKWNGKFPNSHDIVIKTKIGYLIKSNTDKKKLIKALEEMINEKILIKYKETKPFIRGNERIEPQQTYSVVIKGVEKNIKDEDISNHLNGLSLKHRFCRRIISKVYNTPTTFIRIITGEATTSERLLNEGMFFKNRHYLVFPSHPPDPTPMPCSKCHQFDHTSENCTQQLKCSKCQGTHKTANCKTNLPPKCTACGAEDHLAWSTKCPRHPKKPIEGIPNVTIKPLNRKSREIEEIHKKSSRIHAPITTHDDIINTYIRKLNKPKNINREELLYKLKKRFMSQYKIDTTAVFSGNRVYILMFDMDEPNEPSPTEPVDTNNIRQVQLEH